MRILRALQTCLNVHALRQIRGYVGFGRDRVSGGPFASIRELEVAGDLERVLLIRARKSPLLQRFQDLLFKHGMGHDRLGLCHHPVAADHDDSDSFAVYARILCGPRVRRGRRSG